jgi:putative transposase
LDFVADQLENGQRFRALTVVDVFTRESVAIEVGQNLRGGTRGHRAESAHSQTGRADEAILREWQ